jgi:hypothetical protein
LRGNGFSLGNVTAWSPIRDLDLSQLDAEEALAVAVVTIFTMIVFVGLAWQALADRWRRAALRRLAARLSLDFRPEKDPDMVRRFSFLAPLREGHDRYAFNVLSGGYHGHQVLVFDHHYQISSATAKGSTTHRFYGSIALLRLPGHFPQLTIKPEDWSSKLAQAVGFDDIDFESAEFSRKFCVRSHDKRFAYDICHPRMMEYLLANAELCLQIEADVLALLFETRPSPSALEQNLERLVTLRSLFPAYLWRT